MTELTKFLPNKGLPRTSFAADTEIEGQVHSDCRAQRGSAALHRQHGIKYCFNAEGYRCAEFDVSANIRIISIGCGYVMGVGLPQNDLFHERFAERLRSTEQKSVVNWNLGLPGGSNDYICRMLFLAVPLLNPHIVLVNFTHVDRREYVSLQNKMLFYRPKVRRHDLIERNICRHFDALRSPLDDVANFFRNYKAIESLLSRRLWLFSAIESDAFQFLSEYMDNNRFVGYLAGSDLAQDQVHPGPMSHDNLMERYWNRFISFGAELPRIPKWNS